MDFQTYALINGPLVFLNIVTIAFYMFCMVCPLHGEKIKQPLKLLLWSLISFTITYMVSVIFAVGFPHVEHFVIEEIIFAVMVCSVSNSMTSSVWLNFFYCSQIVPAQRALFIWIKKNVKSIIYCFWITEKMYSLFDFTSLILLTIHNGTSNHSTVVHDMPVRDFFEEFRTIMFVIVFSIMKAYFVFCLCVMVMSTGSTVLYLSGHMRRMVANGQPLSCPQFRNQVRVTGTGILQGVLYVFCASWTILNYYPGGDSYNFNDVYIDSTVINLYMLGTLFNLGAGQAVFRQRAAHIWLRAAQCCKSPQVQQSEQGV